MKVKIEPLNPRKRDLKNLISYVLGRIVYASSTTEAPRPRPTMRHTKWYTPFFCGVEKDPLRNFTIKSSLTKN